MAEILPLLSKFPASIRPVTTVHHNTRDLRDDELIQLSLDGSREAFGFLVLRHSRAVRSTILTRLGRNGELDDLVQDCFLRAYRGINRLKNRRSFGSYLRRIASNICIDRLRKRDLESMSLDEVELDPPELAVKLDEDARLPKLRGVVGSLPEALREAVFMFYFENMSLRQMAEALEITEASVSQRLSRARPRMRENFGLGASPA